MNHSTLSPIAKSPSTPKAGNRDAPDEQTRLGSLARHNATLAGADAAEMRSRQLLAAVMAFRDGDFSLRLPIDWEGTDGRIAEAFNQIS